MFRRSLCSALFCLLLLLLLPFQAAASPWLEFGMGGRLVMGKDNVKGISSTGFAFMDTEFAFWSPGLTIGNASLHVTGVGEFMVGFGRHSATVTRSIAELDVETSEESITGAYLSAMLGLGAQAFFGGRGGVQLLFIKNFDRSFFNKTTDWTAHPGDSAAFSDMGWEPFLEGFWQDGRNRFGAGIGKGWYRLGLRRPNPLSDNPYSWIEYRLEYLHERSNAFDYGGVCFKVAIGGTLGDW